MNTDSAYKLKGSVDDINELPTDAEIGDTYVVHGDIYCCIGDLWENMGMSTLSTSRIPSFMAIKCPCCGGNVTAAHGIATCSYCGTLIQVYK